MRLIIYISTALPWIPGCPSGPRDDKKGKKLFIKVCA
jgi:hypothetical protein